MSAEFASLIQAIPATFWGVIVGSCLTLGGVVITNRANDKRLTAQLAHDRTSRNRDRDLSLRTEIYLDAAEAISAGMNAIMRFADLDVPNNQLMAGYTEKSASVAKIFVIAGDDASRAVTVFLGELTSVYLQLLPARHALSLKMTGLDTLTRQVERSSHERDRLADLMKQSELEGATDQHRWSVILDNLDVERHRIDTALAQHRDLAAAFYGEQLAYMTECARAHARLNRMLIPVLGAVRAEIGLPFDAHHHTELVEEIIRKQQISMQEFVQAARGPAAASPSLADPPQGWHAGGESPR